MDLLRLLMLIQFTSVRYFDEGQPYAQMIKYENKFVEIFPTGEVEEFFLHSTSF